VDHAVTDEPQFDARFVNWSMPAADGRHVFCGFEDSPTLLLRDCQFGGGSFLSGMTFTTRLFDRVGIQLFSVTGDFITTPSTEESDGGCNLRHVYLRNNVRDYHDQSERR
jgi:hypothetical protein